ncbi:hypothetical protein HanPSC8_Chr09g0374531 [Helianthus annuus]|nr:hypothetical protein HanPSC8_Chr09g0374531 [Helianthus annuus]
MKKKYRWESITGVGNQETGLSNSPITHSNALYEPGSAHISSDLPSSEDLITANKFVRVSSSEKTTFMLNSNDLWKCVLVWH